MSQPTILLKKKENTPVKRPNIFVRLVIRVMVIVLNLIAGGFDITIGSNQSRSKKAYSYEGHNGLTIWQSMMFRWLERIGAGVINVVLGAIALAILQYVFGISLP